MSNVDHPSWYNVGGIEVIDAIDAWGLDFELGNAVKYIARAGHKDAQKTLEDLKKAQWYINREIINLEKKTRVADAIRHELQTINAWSEMNDDGK